MSKGYVGSAVQEFLEADGIRQEVEEIAQKRVLAWQLRQAMRKSGINKMRLAELMGTSRTQVDRLLDPGNTRVQLDTLQRAARAVNGRLSVELLERSSRSALRRGD